MLDILECYLNEDANTYYPHVDHSPSALQNGPLMNFELNHEKNIRNNNGMEKLN